MMTITCLIGDCVLLSPLPAKVVPGPRSFSSVPSGSELEPPLVAMQPESKEAVARSRDCFVRTWLIPFRPIHSHHPARGRSYHRDVATQWLLQERTFTRTLSARVGLAQRANLPRIRGRPKRVQTAASRRFPARVTASRTTDVLVTSPPRAPRRAPTARMGFRPWSLELRRKAHDTVGHGREDSPIAQRCDDVGRGEPCGRIRTTECPNAAPARTGGGSSTPARAGPPRARPSMRPRARKSRATPSSKIGSSAASSAA